MQSLMRSISEDELRTIASILREGAEQKVSYTFDVHAMADEAATISKRACLSALEQLKPHLDAIDEYHNNKR